jgi:predicted transcriptional regulator
LTTEIDNILVSLAPEHAVNVFSGRKTVEIRRRSMNVREGTRIWIYAKLPIGAILGFATISKVDTKSPERLWRLYGSQSAIQKGEFSDYLYGRAEACAIVLEKVTELSEAIPLTELRKLESDFQPPQFFTKLNGLAAKLEKLSRQPRKARETKN